MMKSFWRGMMAMAIACCVWFAGGVLGTPAALAVTQVKLTDVTYHDCPADVAKGAVTSGTMMAASCYIITGTADNPTNKTVYNADIFGRIYDANHNSVMQNRTRLGSVEEIPPGKSTFEMRISVPASQPAPLQLEQFKASGFTGKVRR
ncbi:MAG TPA: hypothetical protein V6C88_17585 [Chroococcidiopsis sp.]